MKKNEKKLTRTKMKNPEGLSTPTFAKVAKNKVVIMGTEKRLCKYLGR